jgi:hypothetical protein
LARTRDADSADRGGGCATFHRRPRGGGGVKVKLRDLHRQMRTRGGESVRWEPVDAESAGADARCERSAAEHVARRCGHLQWCLKE